MSFQATIDTPIEDGKYPLDGRPEITVVVDAVFEDTQEVDATLLIRLPSDSEFINVQFLSLEGAYNNDYFQVTYRQGNGRVCSRTFSLLEMSDNDELSIFDGAWKLSREVTHVFIDKHSK